MMMMNTTDLYMQFGSSILTILIFYTMYERYTPYAWQVTIHSLFCRHAEKVVRFFSPYLCIKIDEFTGDYFDRNKIYSRIETYLSERTTKEARGLKAKFMRNGKALVLGLDDGEEVVDVYEGVKVWWIACWRISGSQTISFYPGTNEKRYYKLKFHSRHRQLITESYMKYVIEQGKLIQVMKRQRKLFTNIEETSNYSRRSWTHVDFHHPARFDTLAMVPSKKEAIVNDLLRFSKAKDYYVKIGKPYKRGYLLYGPPGTGKSTMIVAMANFLEYDIYDLELTTVRDNTHLRKLLIGTSSKSIIVIEDIDCSLDLTGKRAAKKEKNDDDQEEEEDEKEAVKKKLKQGEEGKKSEVTLSGLLNFIDGIWSACSEERVIIFTTNHIEKLDPALIRRGRMDMHIELSYCCFESFKVLARNYLDVETHPLFDTIRRLLEEVQMSPADVAECLMPKSLDLDVNVCLENLIEALEKAKEEARLKKEQEEKAKEEAKLKEEEEIKSKAEKEPKAVVVEEGKDEEGSETTALSSEEEEN